MTKPCMFCSIVSRDTPATWVGDFNVPGFVAFFDHRPQLRTHVIVASAEHVESLTGLNAHRDRRLLAEQFTLAHIEAARLLKLRNFRVVINVGIGKIGHLHAHILSDE